jgi:hypothetical protein
MNRSNGETAGRARARPAAFCGFTSDPALPGVMAIIASAGDNLIQALLHHFIHSSTAVSVAMDAGSVPLLEKMAIPRSQRLLYATVA